MKKNTLTLISIFYFLNLNAQEIERFDYELVGALVLKENQLISYKIEFNSSKNGFIQGYSYTDLDGENETKSFIKGYYNPKDKNIQFKESDILYTKSKFLPEEFCFVEFKGKFEERSKKKMLKGKFIGIYNDKDTCATGQINLVGTNFLENKIKKIYKKIYKIKKIDDVVKEEIKPENYLKKFSETKIKSGEKVSVFVYTKKMKMEIWDYGKEDGDIVTILLNGVTVLENFHVTKKRKSVLLNLDEKESLIKIISVDSGKIKTNTTKLKLYDFRRQYEVIADLEEGKDAEINVVRLKFSSNK